MKKIVILGAMLLLAMGGESKTVVSPAAEVVTCIVRNPNDFDVKDAPVVIPVSNPLSKSALVLDGKTEVPSQLDIIDSGTTHELCFVLDLKAGQTKLLKVIFSPIASKNRYPSRVNAQMFLKEGGVDVARDTVSAEADNMYNKLQHHGPAFESELAAYRLYFDQKQTVDIYGKVLKRIELPTTKWYPTDQQLIDQYGDDVLYVGGSVGLGTLKGWDGERTFHVKDMKQRTMTVVARGPVRAIVDLDVKGWVYGSSGRTIDLHSRYTIYAGHRDAAVSHTFSENVQGLNFATGVQKIRRGDVMSSDGTGTVADWGRDFPVTDTVKYPQQTVGLAVSIPTKYVVSETTDPINYLYIVKPDSQDKIEYRITMAAEKESFGYKTANDFFDYVARWRDEKPLDVVVRPR